jgi:hypothetical protein
MERTDETAGSRELSVLCIGCLERIRHVRRGVGRIGQTARFSRVEAPRRATTWAQVQRRQRVDLAGVCNWGNRSENPLRLVDARAVIRLNAPEVRFDDATRVDLFVADGLLNPFNRGLVNLEARRASSRPLLCTRIGGDFDEQKERQQGNKAKRHARGAYHAMRRRKHDRCQAGLSRSLPPTPGRVVTGRGRILPY